mgnify:CR=1 FL=1
MIGSHASAPQAKTFQESVASTMPCTAMNPVTATATIEAIGESRPSTRKTPAASCRMGTTMARPSPYA